MSDGDKISSAASNEEYLIGWPTTAAVGVKVVPLSRIFYTEDSCDVDSVRFGSFKR